MSVALLVGCSIVGLTVRTPVTHASRTSPLRMGFFDQLKSAFENTVRSVTGDETYEVRPEKIVHGVHRR